MSEKANPIYRQSPTRYRGPKNLILQDEAALRVGVKVMLAAIKDPESEIKSQNSAWRCVRKTCDREREKGRPSAGEAWTGCRGG